MPVNSVHGDHIAYSIKGITAALRWTVYTTYATGIRNVAKRMVKMNNYTENI